MGYLDKTDFDVVKYVMDLNFMAPMHLTKLVAKEMKKSNTKGLISVVSSIASGGMSNTDPSLETLSACPVY